MKPKNIFMTVSIFLLKGKKAKSCLIIIMLVDNQLIKVVSLFMSEFSLSQYNPIEEELFKNVSIRKHLASLKHKFSRFKIFHETKK